MKTLLLAAFLLALSLAPSPALPLRDSLAMFESGATVPSRSAADLMLGGAGEISRFQILPEVWRAYSPSREYTNPEIAWEVAHRILGDRIKHFQEITNRPPSAVEIYLLWNKPGHFESAGFELKSVKKLYLSRAERFGNLYTRLSALAAQ